MTAPRRAVFTALLGRCTQKTRDWFTSEYGTAECVPKGRHDLLVAQLNKAIKAAEAANADNQ